MKFSFALFMVVIISFLISCNSHEKEEAATTPVISDSLIRTLQTAPVVPKDESNIVKLNGKIQPDESRLVKVYALVSGKIQKVNVELGDFVHKGQTLAILKSTEVAGTSNDLVLAESNVAMTKKALETTKDLYDGKLATEQDFINAKLAYNNALAQLNKAKQVASITGGQNSSYVITAPITGYVIEKTITNNSAVRSDNSADLFAIADLSRVWVMANVYEADINNIHLGDSVRVNTLASPEKNYIGKVDKIYNVLDPATRTMQVRISMDNATGELKPEMFATVTLSAKSSGKLLSIPSHAIVMDDSRNFVIVKKGNKLDVKEINLVKRLEDEAYILGLSEGDSVVTSSQVFLYQALTTK
ncbi:MAG: efflux RND transporter periplasmic adaptor subunit [Flavisolibacter sp.]